MEPSQTDQLEYYLSSLGELGGVLIDAKKIESIGSGVLRLTLGTVMASKGAIFLYNKNEKLSLLCSKGVSLKEKYSCSNKLKLKLKKHSNTHLIFKEKNKILSKEIRENLSNEKIELTIPLFHKEKFLGILCVGSKFMKQDYSTIDIKILEIIGSHLTKALFNYELIKKVEEKKKEISLKLLELETLFDISVAISSVLDIKELSEDVLWRSVGILNASKGLILLENEESPILNPFAAFNWDNKTPLISKNLNIFKQINKNSRGVFFTNKESNEIQIKLKEKNLIITPIAAKKNQGYMVLCNKETRTGIDPFNHVDLDLLTALCNQAAVAMENAKLFKEITAEKQFNESILSSIATGVITIDSLGEIDSINKAGVNILKKEQSEIIGNHYMYLFEKDENIIELINTSEIENKITTEINIPLNTVSSETIINMSVSPRIDPKGKTQGQVISIEDISDISKVKNTFKRYVSKQVVDEILDNEAKLNLGGEKREVVVLFTDIRGFTSMSEKMEPEKVVTTLNEYFTDMIDIVFKYNGTIDKIIGDELMVVYGAPLSTNNDTERAIKTAVEMQQKIKKLNKERKKRKEEPICVGIGINRGDVISGNIGSRDMMDYTVIGDTVNLGSRLCSSAKPNEILVSKPVYIKTKEMFKYKPLDSIKVKGKKDKIELYKVLF